MLEQFRKTYAAYKWLRYTTWIGALAGSVLLFWISGGFPPQAWRFMVQTLPKLPQLWILKGPFILLPLLGLTMLSLTLLVSWVFLVTLIGWMVIQQWHHHRELQLFETSFQKAQQKAYALTKSNMEYEQLWEEQTVPIHQEAVRTTNRPASLSAPPIATLEPHPPLMSEALTQAPAPGICSVADGIQQVPNGNFRLEIGTGIDPGIKRKNKPNEDRLLAIQGTLANDAYPRPFGLFVIADGMGGHANGQEASRLAIQNIRDAILPALLSNVDIDDEHCAEEILVYGVQYANQAVYQHNQDYLMDIGSTITAALIVGSTISIANVGDSRTYLYREHQGLTKVTNDHSVVARFVESGQITPDEIYSHPRRNEIFRCLGEKEVLEIDTFKLPLETGITLLLCSDGLWEMVRDPDMQKILKTTLPDTSRTSKALIQAALDGGGLDNVSVIVVHIM